MVRLGGAADHIQTTGLVWFQPLMTASYLGAAGALAQRLFDREVPGRARRGVEEIIELEAASAALVRGLPSDERGTIRQPEWRH